MGAAGKRSPTGSIDLFYKNDLRSYILERPIG